jgi:hypothetical protein
MKLRVGQRLYKSLTCAHCLPHARSLRKSKNSRYRCQRIYNACRCRERLSIGNNAAFYALASLHKLATEPGLIFSDPKWVVLSIHLNIAELQEAATWCVGF